MAGICSGPAYILASSSGVTPNMKLGTSLGAATITSSRGVKRSHLTVRPSTVSWKWLYSPNAPYQGLLTVADNFGPSLVSSLWISKLFVGQ